MVAETATFPIDLIKTRLQLHGESSAVRLVSEILRNDGVFGLYKGLSPAIIRHLFYTPIRIVNYEFLRNLLVRDDDCSLSLSSKATIGGLSGVIAQWIAHSGDEWWWQQWYGGSRYRVHLWPVGCYEDYSIDWWSVELDTRLIQ
ncbi:Mitochondrial uncoupling protein 3 [Capsicum annuum]|uniref:Mitochondrial uncoupling protein 3 n=1 Tax=Capsicum annuum TaxID=4072 RepID=A0A2G2XXZ5_CAPAN|nr:Mitochondrial uncoupling protein 3 [Capsicum annuum]